MRSSRALSESPRPAPSLPPSAADGPPGPPRTPAPAADGPPPERPFGAALRALGRRLDDGERAARDAERGLARGRDLAPGELLLLQARLYRYGEAVDLTSKLVDRATNAARTVLQAQ